MDKIANNGKDIAAKRGELKPKRAPVGRQAKPAASLKTTPQQLTRRLEALGAKLDELSKRNEAADSLAEDLQDRSEALEQSTDTLKAQTGGLQVKTEDLAIKLEGVSSVATALEERVSQLSSTRDELVVQLEELKAEIATLADKDNIFTATESALEERAENLESATGELKAQVQAFQERSDALAERTVRLETAVKEISPQLQTLQGDTARLTKQGEALEVGTERLEKQLRDVHTSTDQLSIRTDKLENKVATQASLLKDLAPRTDRFIARSRKGFWLLGGGIVFLVIAGVWLHLNHLNRIDTAVATVDTQLHETSQTQRDLQMLLTDTQTDREQTNRSLEQMEATLKAQEQRLNELRRDVRTAPAADPGVSKPAERENTEDRLGASLYDARWLLAQPAEYYTLQLLTATNEAWLANLVRRYPLPEDSAHFRTIEGGWYRYKVVTGAYESPRAASQALEALPEPWQRYNPWVRKIGPIQETISAR